MENVIQTEGLSRANLKREGARQSGKWKAISSILSVDFEVFLRYEVVIAKPGEISRDLINHRGLRPMDRQESLSRGMA